MGCIGIKRGTGNQKNRRSLSLGNSETVEGDVRIRGPPRSQASALM